MELSEKIQKLRKERGLTQEQLAQALFVSRTAVSKWETGRGTPGMESLQLIAKYFGITLDELLRTEEVITIAERENRENLCRFAAWVDGIFNLAAVMGLLLPLYKVERDGVFLSVPLYRFDGWQAALFWLFPAALMACGGIQLLVNRGEGEKLKRGLTLGGLLLNIAAVFLLILSGQPYPAALFFALLVIKGAVLLAKQR